MEDDSKHFDQIRGSLLTDFGLAVDNIQPITTGFVNEVYQAQLSKKEIIIRIAKKRNSYPLEIWAFKRFRSLGIPVPEIIDYQENPVSIGHPTMIMTKLEGTPLGDDLTNTQAGEMLKTIHTIEIDGFGFFEVGDTIHGQNNTWAEFWNFMDMPGQFKLLLENKLIPLDDFNNLLAVHAAIDPNIIRNSRFIYNDFHKAHIFTDGQKITGIIDPGNAIAGDPRYDIAVSLFFQNNHQQQAFKKGYGDLANDPLVNQYLILVCAQKAAWRFAAGRLEDAKSAVSRLSTNVS